MTTRKTVFGIGLALLCLSQTILVDGSPKPQDFKKMGLGVRKKCLAETGTTADIVDETELGNFAEDDQLKCYFKCILEKFNMFGKKDKLNFNLMKKIVPDHFRDIGYDMIDSCTDITGPNRCELAYNFMKCLYNANPVAFFVV